MKKINISMRNGFGIGDTICGLYAVAGIRQTFPDAEINYYSQRPGWAELATGFNSYHVNENPDKCNEINLYDDYHGELKTESDRKSWYLRDLGISPARPRLAYIPGIDLPIVKGDYVLFSPFASWSTRTWPVTHWLYLENLIVEQLGYKVIIVDEPGKDERSKDFQGARYWGQPPPMMANLIRHAKITIGNDSGIPHVAGLLDAPTLALITHIKPDNLFSLTGVDVMTSPEPCVGCYWKMEKGYRAACNINCHALACIPPRQVFQAVLTILSRRENNVRITA